MNKKELNIFATQVEVFAERVEYHKKMTRFYYNLAVNAFKDTDKKYAVKYWSYAKGHYLQYIGDYNRWYSLLDMKYLLGIDIYKYYNAVDKKAVEEEKARHEKINVDKVTYKFLYRVEKIMKGGKY